MPESPDTFRVRKGVHLPEKVYTPTGLAPANLKYPFAKVEVDELFFVPDKTTDQLSSYAALRGRQLDRKFTTQMAWMRQNLQTFEWEPCSAGAPGSRHGVAIRRVK